jgi:hypothetical protein
VSPSEIAFLAVGLVLGAAIGAALVQISGSGLAPRREVRLTITPNAIPARRAHTLGVPYGMTHSGIIPGSPDADALAGALPALPETGAAPVSAAPGGYGPIRTRVPSHPVVMPTTAVAVPVALAAAGPAERWPVLVARGPRAVLARTRLEQPGRDDPFATPVSPRRTPGEDRPTATGEASR